jgi:hypothetical protein
MHTINTKENKNEHDLSGSSRGGYAILFAVVMISVITTLAIGLANTTYKQLVLSSVAKDSQTAFFQSDTATECALYTVYGYGYGPQNEGESFPCGIDKNGDPYQVVITATNGQAGTDYTINPYTASPTYNDADPCFSSTYTLLSPSSNPADPTVDIKARGYNVCDPGNPRKVEREIELTF